MFAKLIKIDLDNQHPSCRQQFTTAPPPIAPTPWVITPKSLPRLVDQSGALTIPFSHISRRARNNLAALFKMSESCRVTSTTRTTGHRWILQQFSSENYEIFKSSPVPTSRILLLPASSWEGKGASIDAHSYANGSAPSPKPPLNVARQRRMLAP